MLTLKSIIDSKALFFDFDGVIKDSVEVKGNAFEQLFLPQGKEIGDRVRAHHESNGGMSRYEKLPLYLHWAGLPTDQTKLEEYSRRFSGLVKQRVIESDWVPGAETYLHTNPFDQILFIITATPQSEIDEIIDAIGLTHCFTGVIGAPTKKEEAIHQLIQQYNINTELSVMIGDSITDYLAAVENKVPFVLRKTNSNLSLQNKLKCPMINDFKNLNKELSDG